MRNEGPFATVSRPRSPSRSRLTTVSTTYRLRVVQRDLGCLVGASSRVWRPVAAGGTRSSVPTGCTHPP